MSNNHYKAQIVKFSAYISNGTQVFRLPVISANFRHTIGDLPMVEIVAQLDNSKLTDLQLNLSDFANLAKETQQQLINSFRMNADIQIRVEDGQGADITFNGFISRPEFSIHPGMLVLRYAAVHTMNGLQGFNMNIYNIEPYFGATGQNVSVLDGTQSGTSQQDVTAILASSKFTNKSSIAARIETLIELTMAAYTSKISLLRTTESINDLVAIHQANQQTYKTFVKKLLDASIQGTVLPGLAATDDPDSTPSDYLIGGIDNEIRRALFSAEHFAGFIPDLCAAFRFQFNASWDGTAWLEPLQMFKDPGPRFIRVPTEGIQFSVANSFEMPLFKVYMYLPLGESWAYSTVTPAISPVWSVFTGNEAIQLSQSIDSGEAAVMQATVLGNEPDLLSYPPTKLTPNSLGTFYIIVPPSWVIPEASMLANNEDTDDTSDLSTKGGVKSMHNSQQQRNAFTDLKRRYLQQIVEDTFNERFLGGTTATISLPFCAPIKVGYTYVVQDMTTGAPLFTGYLQSVGHVASIDGTNSSLSTNCVFTHIKMVGVTFVGAGVVASTPSVQDPVASITNVGSTAQAPLLPLADDDSDD